MSLISMQGLLPSLDSIVMFDNIVCKKTACFGDVKATKIRYLIKKDPADNEKRVFDRSIGYNYLESLGRSCKYDLMRVKRSPLHNECDVRHFSAIYIVWTCGQQ